MTVLHLVLGLGAVGAILLGVRLHRPALAVAWYLMALGQLLWVVGETVAWFEADVPGATAVLSAADLFCLAAYPVLAAGMWLLVRGRRPRVDVPGLLDGATVTAGLGLLAWVCLVGPALADNNETGVAAAVAIAYPAGGILLLGGLVLLLTTPGARSRALQLLLVAASLRITADVLYAAEVGRGSTFVEVLIMASYVAWGMAALDPSMAPLSRPQPHTGLASRRLRVLALVMATLLAPALLAVEALVGGSVGVWPVICGSVLMFLLVIARMNVAIVQMGRLNEAREQLQAELEHQALHDPMTGLPNRALALQLLQESLARTEANGSSSAVLFVDLDGFKAVNDTHGHRAGDDVLRAVAQRMLGEVRDADTPCRLGGDEFVVILEDIADEATAVNVAERLITELSRPVDLDDELEVAVGASIGVALGSSADTDPEALLHEADVAVYRAKGRGKGRVELFDSSVRREFTHPSEMEAALTRAIEEDELVVRYQPIVDTVSRALLGLEALVRWDRPDIGLVPPSAFIPVAESSSLICDLDSWMLRTATRQLATWSLVRGRTDLHVAVNVSGRHISMPRIVGDVRDALTASGIEPAQLVLEITETYLVDDRPALVNLAELRRLGVGISLDDFGTGYNSFARLASLPVDVVKIDRKYVDTASRSSRTLLELMVHAAHEFGLPVVGEGVERTDQLELLRSVGCEMAQGFLLGRPQSAEELADRVVAADAAHLVTPA